MRLERITEAVEDAAEEALALGAATLSRGGFEDDRAELVINQLRQDDDEEMRVLEAATVPHRKKERG